MPPYNLVNYKEFCHVVIIMGLFILTISYNVFCASYIGSGTINMFSIGTSVFGAVLMLEGVVASLFKGGLYDTNLFPRDNP